MYESCCSPRSQIRHDKRPFLLKPIVFQETKANTPGSGTRSIPHRLPSVSRTYLPSPNQSLWLRSGFRSFFAHSPPSIRCLFRSHTLLQSRRNSVVSSAPLTPVLQCRTPQLYHSWPVVRRTLTSFVVRPPRSCGGYTCLGLILSS